MFLKLFIPCPVSSSAEVEIFIVDYERVTNSIIKLKRSLKVFEEFLVP